MFNHIYKHFKNIFFLYFEHFKLKNMFYLED